jgi:hypothetical protein
MSATAPLAGWRDAQAWGAVGLRTVARFRRGGSLKNVLSERARVYRSVINGALTAIEGVRLSFILRKVRCTLKAVAAEAARAAEAAAQAAAAAQVEKSPLVVNVMGIPEGYYHQPDGGFRPSPPDTLQLEYATPEPAIVSASEPELEPAPAPEPELTPASEIRTADHSANAPATSFGAARGYLRGGAWFTSWPRLSVPGCSLTVFQNFKMVSPHL